MSFGEESVRQLHEAFDELRELPTHVVKIREDDASMWRAASYGEPYLRDWDFTLGPGRIRFVEQWQKIDGLHRVGRATVELQYVFPGSSMLDAFEEDDTDWHLTASPDQVVGHSLIIEELHTNADSEFLPDRSYSLIAKFQFAADGTGFGILKRREEEVPYIVGLDEAVKLEYLQEFGRVVGKHQAEYGQEVIVDEISVDVAARVCEFAIVEASRIEQRMLANPSRVYRS